jgi:hypothetical protein
MPPAAFAAAQDNKQRRDRTAFPERSITTEWPVPGLAQGCVPRSGGIPVWRCWRVSRRLRCCGKLAVLAPASRETTAIGYGCASSTFGGPEVNQPEDHTQTLTLQTCPSLADGKFKQDYGSIVRGAQFHNPQGPIVGILGASSCSLPDWWRPQQPAVGWPRRPKLAGQSGGDGMCLTAAPGL